MKTNEAITFRKDNAVTVTSGHYIFMSDGRSAIYFYQNTLSREYPSIKTWDDLVNAFKPKIFELYDLNGVSKHIVLI